MVHLFVPTPFTNTMRLLLLTGFLLFPFWVSSQTSNCPTNIGQDAVVCTGAFFPLNPNGPAIGQYQWSGTPALTCSDCPNPAFSAFTPGIYTYIVNYTAPQCAFRDTVTITVLAGQQPQYNIAPDQDICTGSTISIGGTPVLGNTYLWYSNPPTFNANGSQFSVSPTENITWYVAVRNAACPVPAIDSVVIRVYEPPVLSLRSDTAICPDAPVRLGNTIPQSGVTYQWTPDNGTLSSTIVAVPIAVTSATTNYTLTASNKGCIVSQSVNIIAVPLELTLNVPDTLRICRGQSVQVEVATQPLVPSILWTPLLGVQLASNGRVATLTPASDVTYRIQTQVSGCARTRNLTVLVSNLPDLPVSGADTTICPGQSVRLRSPDYNPAAFPNLTFQWSGNGIMPPTNQKDITVSPTTTTTYRRIIENRGCQDTTFVTVNVRDSRVTISPLDTAICTGQSVTLRFRSEGGTITSPNWSPAAGLSCNNCPAPVVTPAATTSYVASGTDPQSGCPFSAMAIVRVSNAQTITFPADTKLCIGDSIVLNTTPDPTATYTWSASDPAFSSTQPAPITQPTRNITYFVKTSNACGQKQEQLQVEVFDGALQTSQDTTVCKNFPALLTATGAFPGTYSWDSGQSGQAINVMTEKTRTFTVLYTYGDGCSLKKGITVFIANESADVMFPTDTRICSGDSIQLNTQNTPGATYEWSSSPTGFFSNNPTPVVRPNENTIYLVTTRLGDCVQTQTLSVEVAKSNLQVTKDTTICKGEVLTLRAVGTAIGQSQYRWLLGTDTLSRTDTWTTFANQSATYDLIYTFGDGCEIRRKVNVVMRPGIDSVNIVADPDTMKIFSGGSITLRAIVSPTQSLTGFQFNWLENETIAVGTGETITISRTTDSDEAQKYRYRVTARAQNGCRKTDVFDLTVCPELVVFPNVFTPDGDQNNDTFSMYVIGGNVRNESLKIYNRWGNLLFESTESAARWDGNSNGKQAPTDVYIYIQEYRLGDGRLLIAKGEVTLLR
jgi:gliding motility-associated-like protein